MYGLWGYLLKAKSLAPINARRVLEGGWYLKKLSNKKHRNPLETELRKEYYVQNKTFKKLIKHEKQQFFDSKVNELISNENNRKILG